MTGRESGLASAGQGSGSARKIGILLAAFGSSSRVGEKALAFFTEQARQAFPGIPIRWAFTSPHMRNRLAAARKKTDSVQKALLRMGFDRYTHVAVQSLHLIPGKEYEALLEEIDLAQEKGGPRNVAVGLPLLHDPEDVRLAAEALLAHLPVERKKEDAVVCVGHGTWHAGSASYQSLFETLQSSDPRIFIGTLSGARSIDTVVPALKSAGVSTVWLVPLLSVIGKHAEEDMGGKGEHSWLHRLEKAGFACRVVLKGTVEYSGFTRIWISHLADALAAFEPAAATDKA